MKVSQEKEKHRKVLISCFVTTYSSGSAQKANYEAQACFHPRHRRPFAQATSKELKATRV